MAAAPNNKYASKLEKMKDLGLVKEAYSQFCKHLEEGFVADSWSYANYEKQFFLTAETIEKYIKECPEDFPPIHREIARKAGYKKWETVVNQSAEGLNEKANTASLQMVMRNKYAWDKREREQTFTISCSDLPESYAKGKIKQPD